MIRLLHWISRNTNFALFKKVCNMILLMASFCVCYKRHTSLSERRFCRSYSLDITLIRVADSQCSAQTESRVQTNLAELRGSYRWLLEQTFPSYSHRHVVLFGNGCGLQEWDSRERFLVSTLEFFYCMAWIVEVYLDLCSLAMIFL